MSNGTHDYHFGKHDADIEGIKKDISEIKADLKGIGENVGSLQVSKAKFVGVALAAGTVGSILVSLFPYLLSLLLAA